MKILFHCHHSVGIGHLVRTLQLANACLELGQVVVICGGEVPRHLKIDSRIRIEELAPLNMAQDGTLYDPRGLDEVSDILRQRRKMNYFAGNCIAHLRLFGQTISPVPNRKFPQKQHLLISVFHKLEWCAPDDRQNEIHLDSAWHTCVRIRQWIYRGCIFRKPNLRNGADPFRAH